MKHLLALGAIACLLSGGCSQETKQSIENDAQKNAENASEKAREAMGGVQSAAENATAATTLTPRLKSAITADSELNDGKNLINIDSTKDTVTIDGHVYSEDLKARAERIVRDEMAKANAKQNVVNNLSVKAG